MLSDKSDSMNPSLPAQSPYTRTRAPVAPFVAILFLAAVFASGCVIHDHGRGGHYAGPVAVQPRVAVAVPVPVTFTFTDHHRYSAQNYYHEHPSHHGKKNKKHKWKKKHKNKGRGHLPPGLAKRDVLPPGIQMQAIHGDLARQLPHPPHGSRYTYYNDQVLLIDLNTRVVLDFINIQVSAGF
jgi:Ni/Co efflux regulator RcnB